MAEFRIRNKVTITRELFSRFLPRAIQWARDGEALIIQFGRGLDPQEEADALLAGIRSPRKVRISVVPRIPRPVDGILALANQQVGLVTDMTGGLTLNYGIFLRADCAHDTSLLFHEFVHVAQYERLGGIDCFLPKYLEECVLFGYPNSPLEIEAVEMTRKMK